jgi:hypothetical protein
MDGIQPAPAPRGGTCMHRGPLGECDVSLTCALEAPQLPASAHQATIRAHTGWQVAEREKKEREEGGA